jgi:hypothetical protein
LQRLGLQAGEDPLTGGAEPPQLMIISRPTGSSSNWRLVSAYSSIARSVTVNRHG